LGKIYKEIPIPDIQRLNIVCKADGDTIRVGAELPFPNKIPIPEVPKEIVEIFESVD
jgi:hypothetical protein